MAKRTYTADEAKQIGEAIGVTWDTFDVEQFRQGLEVESEHGSHDPETNVTDDNPIVTGKIAWAHLKEYPDYYERHRKMEQDAENDWRNQSTK